MAFVPNEVGQLPDEMPVGWVVVDKLEFDSFVVEVLVGKLPDDMPRGQISLDEPTHVVDGRC